MSDQCAMCKIRPGCDFLSKLCRLAASEVATERPELIRPLTDEAMDDFWQRVHEERVKANREKSAQYFDKHREAVNRRQSQWWHENKDAINEARRVKRRQARVQQI